MYRVLREAAPVVERRSQRRHPEYVKPEVVATAPNLAWSWDIERQHSPVPGKYFYLYVILDLFSRYVPGVKPRQRQAGSAPACFGVSPGVSVCGLNGVTRLR